MQEVITACPRVWRHDLRRALTQQGHPAADAANTASCPRRASSSTSASPGAWCNDVRAVVSRRVRVPTAHTRPADSADARRRRDGAPVAEPGAHRHLEGGRGLQGLPEALMDAPRHALFACSRGHSVRFTTPLVPVSVCCTPGAAGRGVVRGKAPWLRVIPPVPSFWLAHAGSAMAADPRAYSADAGPAGGNHTTSHQRGRRASRHL